MSRKFLPYAPPNRAAASDCGKKFTMLRRWRDRIAQPSRTHVTRSEKSESRVTNPLATTRF
jgi:hypothetical protein